VPELPEVETIRRGLIPHMVGRVIADVEILDARLVQPVDPRDVRGAMRGRRVEAIDRRGKYLLIRLEGDLVATHHLRMTGSFAVPPKSPVPTHVRLRYLLAERVHPVLYNDPRRFGTLVVATMAETDAHLDARLGPEPLGADWDATSLHRAIHHRTAPIKALLLDQRVVAGLGNIYVDEACFLAGIPPQAAGDRITRPMAARLVTHVRARLEEAIDVGGSTLRDYRGVEGEIGGMRERFLAYGRAGLPCLVCGMTMRGTRIAGRGTTWCPRCQPAVRAR